MVAIRAERPQKTYMPGPAPTPRPQLESGRRKPALSRRIAFVGCEDLRGVRRRPVALRAWLMTLDGSQRGYALDLSESGVKLGGVCSPLQPGERALCKIELRPHEEPVVVRAVVVRNDGRDCALRFVDVNLEEWFRLARYVDDARL